MEKIKAGVATRIDAIMKDAAGAEKTGLTVTVRIQRESDGYFLKNDGTWTAAPSTEYTATETDSTNLPGKYHFEFTPPAGADVYFIRFDGTASAVPRYQYGKAAAAAMGDSDLDLAISRLINKSRQDLETDVIEFYDAAGTTVVLTLTPSNDTGDPETATEIVFTPS